MVIQAFSVARFNLDALAGYCADVERLAQQSLVGDELAILKPLTEARDALAEAMRTNSESFGQAIHDADALADKCWSLLNAQVELNTEHFDPTIREAALTIQPFIEKYGNPTHLPYAEEYNRLDNLLKDLDALDSTLLELANVDRWTAELHRRVDAFNALMTDKTKSKALIEIGAVKSARNALEDAYRLFISKLNALLLLHPDEQHETLATHINELIASRRTTRKAQKTAKQNDK